MPWVKIDEGMTEHRKLAELSDRAFRAEFEALCFANRNLTDGLITAKQARRWKRAAPELVAVRLWELDPEGFRIHDYLKYNPSRAQVEAARERARERMANARGSSREQPAKFPRSSHNPSPSPSPSPKEEDQDSEKKRGGARKRAAPPPEPEVTDEFRARMVERFAPYASAERVNEEIAFACSHTSSRKWIKPELGVLKWLKREWEPVGGGAAHGGSGAHAEAARPGAVARNGYGSGYRAKPNLTPPGEFGDTWDTRPPGGPRPSAGAGGGESDAESAARAGSLADPAASRNGVPGV